MKGINKFNAREQWLSRLSLGGKHYLIQFSRNCHHYRLSSGGTRHSERSVTMAPVIFRNFSFCSVLLGKYFSYFVFELKLDGKGPAGPEVTF